MLGKVCFLLAVSINPMIVYQHLMMAIGKEITVEKTRLSCTAGTFVTFTHNGETVKGILTCAHVAFSKEELLQNVDLPCRNLQVIDKHKLTSIGEVCEAKFQPSQKVGIDAALVKIDEVFLPQYGQVVKDKDNFLKEIGFSEISPPCFCNAQEVLKDDSGNYTTTSVFKFGASSGLTLGDISFDAAVCRTSNLGFSLMDKDPVVLNGQLHIFPRHQCGPDFFTHGDSGAIVFQKNGEEIGAVGLAIGKINFACVVTDIRSILNAFKYADMKLLQFQCDVDSGISMTGPLNSPPAFSESLLTKVSNINISSESCPPQRKRSTDHELIPNNTINVQTRSGLNIEAINSQLKWQREQECFTITSSIPPSSSRLSIRTPDATSIHSVHNGEFELRTETESIRVIHCN
ncbi:uncharacterized protein LOC134245657 [Saccostrea cucullata]|uniref:uncharacterized protein LOC134245657 n=1 Tax=Saccostrea cuccullata TaxID=36930 RepID=UPI002ED10EE5